MLPLLLLLCKDKSRQVTFTRKFILGTEEDTKDTEAMRKGVSVFGQRSVMLKAGLPGQEAYLNQAKPLSRVL